MTMTKPEIVLIAGVDEAWCGPVSNLVNEHLASAIIDPASLFPEDLDVFSVRVMVASPQDAKVFAPRFPNLEWIQSTWAGIDALVGHLPKGISVTPLKGVFGQAMSEFVLGWVLSIERNIIRRASATCWDSEAEKGVGGKTMGILGTGSIGSAIAAAVKPLGIHCRGLNSTGKLVPGFDECFKAGDAQFFKGLDYCVSVLPKTATTDCVLNAQAFAAMADDAIVINVGRGNAIDDDALLRALDRQTLRAAVLDVFTIEPLPDEHPFWQHPQIFVTSHTSAPTAINLVALAMRENLYRYLAGDALKGLYLESKGY